MTHLSARQDQQAILKLRERVTQLDLENTALARAAHGSDGGATAGASSDDANLDVQALMDKITRLKGMLKLANERSEKPVDVDGTQPQLITEVVFMGSRKNCHKRQRKEFA